MAAFNYTITLRLSRVFAEFERKHKGWRVATIPYFVMEHIIDTAFTEAVYQAETQYKHWQHISLWEHFDDISMQNKPAAVSLAQDILVWIRQCHGHDLATIVQSDLVLTRTVLFGNSGCAQLHYCGWQL